MENPEYTTNKIIASLDRDQIEREEQLKGSRLQGAMDDEQGEREYRTSDR